MECDISRSINRFDVPDKIEGKAKYIADYRFPGMLYARTLRSTEARARIKSVQYPDLPEGFYIVDKNDVPGRNGVRVLTYDMPYFADGAVNYIGEPIALVVGPDKGKILDILSNIKVGYERLKPILTMEEGLNADRPIYGDNNLFADYQCSKGDINEAASGASFVYEGEYETGYQEQLYLEPQGVISVYENEKVTVYGSMQCPYYVKNAVVECMGFDTHRVQVVQSTTGGAFGGKEDYPSLLAGQAACAAYKIRKPVQIVLDRDEDVEFTTKRHPSKIRLKSYLDENHRIIGMEVDILLDCGAYASLSNVVLQRAMFAIGGVYNIENIQVRGRTVATNKAVSGAFRGFGAPQAFFAVEMHMEHMAKELSIEPLEFKIKNLLKQGDRSSTGGIFRDRIVLPHMIEKALEMSDYKKKKKEFEEDRKQGRLRGIGMSLFFHGGGFTGSGERDHIKAEVRLKKYGDGTIEILVANTEMGQGAQTTLRKIVAQTIGIPVDKIIYNNPDTDRVPDSGPTVASRTVVVVGKLLLEASEELKGKWDEGEVEVSARYKYPEGFVWDGDNFKGDAYTSYSWGVNVVEVEVDPLTYESFIKGVWAVYDIGKSVDDRIVKGQIDGGILQGLGMGGMEVVENKNGRFLQRTITDCIIPTAKDAPPIESQLICEPYSGGPFGAKALGELTLIGGPSAYALAVEDAVDVKICKVPLRPEFLMEVRVNG